MQRIVILGAGTGGTMAAHKLSRELGSSADITIVDRDPIHYYQPGLLFIPFGLYKSGDIIKPRDILLPKGVHYIVEDVDRVDPQAQKVHLFGGRVLDYDVLVIATGVDIEPREVPGLIDGGWRKTIFDFYTLSGAVALQKALTRFNGGRIVLNVASTPIKSPIAPLEFLFLLDWHLRQREIRQKSEIIFTTPLSGALEDPLAAIVMGQTLTERGIVVEQEFAISDVDGSKQAIRSADNREIPFDLLITIPPNLGAEMIAHSGLGDAMRYVPTDPRTMQSTPHANIFLIGDASALPISKTGSVAHLQLDTVASNVIRFLRKQPLQAGPEGRANGFIESGRGKAYMIDFNYDTPSLQSGELHPGVGPFKLLEESRINHLGKMAFRWAYWNLLLKGRSIPMVTDHMPAAGSVPVLN